MKSRSLQITLISISVLIVVVLFFAPSQVNVGPAKSEIAAETTNENGFDAEALLKSARKALSKDELANLEHFEQALKLNGEKDTAVLDQLGRFWDRNNIPAASAVWFEKKANVIGNEESRIQSAYRYFDAFKVAQDSTLRGILVGKAIAQYKMVLEKNPNNLNAKTDLGVCYVEGSAEPMKGIMMLREVIAANPNHEMAQLNLGLLSVKSGQLDKAIERFNKVLTINPKRTEVYLYLGQVYLQKADTLKAIENYSDFTKKSDDYQTVSQVGKVIDELKKGSSPQK